MFDRGRQHRPQPEEPVYVVRAGGAIKIGVTSNVERRLRTLATGSALPLELLGTLLGGRCLERKLHERFKRFHLRREWFKADDALLSAIRDLLAASPAPRPDAHALAQEGRCRRVLAALDPADLAAVCGVGQKA
jgi:hypothetical protein